MRSERVSCLFPRRAQDRKQDRTELPGKEQITCKRSKSNAGALLLQGLQMTSAVPPTIARSEDTPRSQGVVF